MITIELFNREATIRGTIWTSSDAWLAATLNSMTEDILYLTEESYTPSKEAAIVEKVLDLFEGAKVVYNSPEKSGVEDGRRIY